MRLRRRAGAMVAPLAAALLLGACTGLPQPADPPALPPPALAAAAKPPPAIPAAPAAISAAAALPFLFDVASAAKGLTSRSRSIRSGDA